MKYCFGKEIKSVSQAVSLFGMSMTRSIAIGNSVRKLLNVDMEPYGITSEKFADNIQGLVDNPKAGPFVLGAIQNKNTCTL